MATRPQNVGNMTMPVVKLMTDSRVARRRAEDVDRHVGVRMREQRIMLGLTQQQLAKLIGVTYQQTHKYETGTNRITAGRLSSLAQALGVEVGYFYDGLTSTPGAVEVSPQQRRMLELGRSFMAISSRKHQEAICNLGRSLANRDLGDALDLDMASGGPGHRRMTSPGTRSGCNPRADPAHSTRCHPTAGAQGRSALHPAVHPADAICRRRVPRAGPARGRSSADTCGRPATGGPAAAVP